MEVEAAHGELHASARGLHRARNLDCERRPHRDGSLKSTRAVSIRLEVERTVKRDLETLRDLLQGSPGSCPVELVLTLPDGAEAVLDLDGTRITPTDALLGGLERAFGGSVAELR